MKKILTTILLLATLLSPTFASAVTFTQQQVIITPYSGVLMSTTTKNGGFLQASTSPTLNSITATSTTLTNYFGGPLNAAGNFILSALSQGALYLGSNTTVKTVATSTATVSTGLTYSGTWGQFLGGVSGNLTVNTSQNITTLSNLSTNGVVYTTGGTGVLNVAATSTLTASSPLTGSFTQIGSGGSLGCQTASGSQAGCLSSTDWNTFNGKQPAGSYITAYDAWTHPVQGQSATSSLILLNANASTTGFSTGYGYFGTNATTSIDTSGNVAATGVIALSLANNALVNLPVSSTLANVIFNTGDIIVVNVINPTATITTPAQIRCQIEWESVA